MRFLPNELSKACQSPATCPSYALFEFSLGRVRKRYPRMFYLCLTPYISHKRERQNTLGVVISNATLEKVVQGRYIMYHVTRLYLYTFSRSKRLDHSALPWSPPSPILLRCIFFHPLSYKSGDVTQICGYKEYKRFGWPAWVRPWEQYDRWEKKKKKDICDCSLWPPNYTASTTTGIFAAERRRMQIQRGSIMLATMIANVVRLYFGSVRSHLFCGLKDLLLGFHKCNTRIKSYPIRSAQNILKMPHACIDKFLLIKQIFFLKTSVGQK